MTAKIPPAVSAPVELVDQLSSELDRRHEGRVSTPIVRGYVRRAIRDLRGSVSVGGTPEMALRLADVRLSAYEADRGERWAALASASRSVRS